MAIFIAVYAEYNLALQLRHAHGIRWSNSLERSVGAIRLSGSLDTLAAAKPSTFSLHILGAAFPSSLSIQPFRPALPHLNNFEVVRQPHMGLELSDDVCPRCKAHFLTAPKECLGTFDPENIGQFFQHCARHDFTANAGCKFFLWNDTMENRFEGPVTLPSDPQSSPDRSSSLLTLLATLLCTSSSPRKPREPCSNTMANCHSDRNGACMQLFCKLCCVASSVVCKAPSHNEAARYVINSFTVRTPTTSGSPSPLPALLALVLATPTTPTTTTPLTLTRPYARPVDPSYATKLQAGGFQLNGANQAAAYKKAKAQTVEAFWWAKVCDALRFYLLLNRFTLDRPLIGEMNTRNFSFWDGQWWKLTDAAVTVRIGIPVYLRSCDVTVCLDGPTAPMKRKHSLVFDSPPSTPIQRFQVIEPLVFDVPETQKRKKLDVKDLTSDNENDVFQTTGSSRSSNTKQLNLRQLRLLCFHAMTAQSSGTIAVKFKAAFNTDFTSTTFYDNLNKWKVLSSEVPHQIVTLGRVQEMEWVYVLKNYGKGKDRAI
ncbi:hypothetical protein B0H17DRAFT_1133803 [Mycena rosella]|uniref:Uncharacterized protein n=1 Tax=Mycena rosella TaxID=1033263 RepID=A0AAD7GJS6_MYCRO|nr:hypothetical protein B0H17DRAFT_1133803 [Mycena rosella]